MKEDGVQANRTEALRWIKAAAEQDCPNAVRVLKELNAEHEKKANDNKQLNNVMHKQVKIESARWQVLSIRLFIHA